jgi:hypothetical protein
LIVLYEDAGLPKSSAKLNGETFDYIGFPADKPELRGMTGGSMMMCDVAGRWGGGSSVDMQQVEYVVQ